MPPPPLPPPQARGQLRRRPSRELESAAPEKPRKQACRLWQMKWCQIVSTGAAMAPNKSSGTSRLGPCRCQAIAGRLVEMLGCWHENHAWRVKLQVENQSLRVGKCADHHRPVSLVKEPKRIPRGTLEVEGGLVRGRAKPTVQRGPRATRWKAVLVLELARSEASRSSSATVTG